jgi:hypothetical protein
MLSRIGTMGHAWSRSLRFLCFALLLSIIPLGLSSEENQPQCPLGLSSEENHTYATECSCQALSDAHCARKLAWQATKWQPVRICALQACSNQGRVTTTWNKVAGAMAKHFVGDHDAAMSLLLDALNRYHLCLQHMILVVFVWFKAFGTHLMEPLVCLGFLWRTNCMNQMVDWGIVLPGFKSTAISYMQQEGLQTYLANVC